MKNQPAESTLPNPKKKPVTYHRVLNSAECARGEATTLRALCGHVFPYRRKNIWGNTTSENRARWVYCEACRELEILDLEMN
ncbi:hypothetical protein HMPREF3171_05805 [Corynebacterium sp. HMSC08F01]|uniref:hypothetical protein n=1 Tax=Corynebacterium sp. HMSC08F01 TaxID=1581139 RepID=UPI0008A241AC|nr:hypothetical protein [Corynebacterium sp. HMSC08F01]OFT29705.1 hypothetical protein HMPREF3171_05805 [Corynebacterium sp. HMSC08F01]